MGGPGLERMRAGLGGAAVVCWADRTHSCCPLRIKGAQHFLRTGCTLAGLVRIAWLTLSNGAEAVRAAELCVGCRLHL